MNFDRLRYISKRSVSEFNYRYAGANGTPAAVSSTLTAGLRRAAISMNVPIGVRDTCGPIAPAVP